MLTNRKSGACIHNLSKSELNHHSWAMQQYCCNIIWTEGNTQRINTNRTIRSSYWEEPFLTWGGNWQDPCTFGIIWNGAANTASGYFFYFIQKGTKSGLCYLWHLNSWLADLLSHFGIILGHPKITQFPLNSKAMCTLDLEFEYGFKFNSLFFF